MSPRPLVLIIMDGWGISDEPEGNAICQADLPHYRRYWQEYPHTCLEASGEAVGLPAGQQGNSEVGHLNLGAGRIVYQDLTRISLAIREGSFFTNPVLVQAMEMARRPGKALHLMGLVSDGGVHSHLDHLLALLRMAVRHGVERLHVHAFLDGRDVPPASAGPYLAAVEEKLRDLGRGDLASLMGRYYAMDRDKRWERTARAYGALVAGDGHQAVSAAAGLEAAYARGQTDEFVEPTVITGGSGQPRGLVRPGDAIIFFNFRADRARQLTWSLVDPDFTAFVRPGGFLAPRFVCMAEYEATIPAPVAFPPDNLANTLGQVMSQAGLRQLRLAETEKYAHVTFFFNGGVEEPNPGEDRLLIPSPRVATYDQQPEMSAYQVTEAALERIVTGTYDVIIMNYANADMVGHTGYLQAAVKAVEAVDACLGRVVEAVLDKGGVVLLTADHGNAEKMIEAETGEPHTAHTTNPVPFILIGGQAGGVTLRSGGALRDVAPTMLGLLGLPQPREMTGRTLIKRQ
ncbi:MAG: 2,3-bisphosphoglycerate-independent phosphoglycerate mutase [Clostridia bacterium]|nr:MAG: 2,3-bisphosphoglycerate-independent phosphoglycerate mutase [Clostridia bacterium]